MSTPRTTPRSIAGFWALAAVLLNNPCTMVLGAPLALLLAPVMHIVVRRTCKAHDTKVGPWMLLSTLGFIACWVVFFVGLGLDVSGPWPLLGPLLAPAFWFGTAWSGVQSMREASGYGRLPASQGVVGALATSPGALLLMGVLMGLASLSPWEGGMALGMVVGFLVPMILPVVVGAGLIRDQWAHDVGDLLGLEGRGLRGKVLVGSVELWDRRYELELHPGKFVQARVQLPELPRGVTIQGSGGGPPVGDPILDQFISVHGEWARAWVRGRHEQILPVFHGFPGTVLTGGVLTVTLSGTPEHVARQLERFAEAVTQLVRGLDEDPDSSDERVARPRAQRQ